MERNCEARWILGMILLTVGAVAFPAFGSNEVEGSDYSSSPLMAMRGVFVLGDSSVDCGENTLFYSLLHRNLSVFPCDRSESTILIPHFLAAKMNLPKIPSFYSQNGTIRGLLNGLNFGSVQASIMLDPALIASFQSLTQQLRQAFETIQVIDLLMGQTRSHRFLESSIFFLSFGKEDFTRFFFSNQRHRQNSSFLPRGGYDDDPHIFVQILVDQMIQAIRDLYNSGVRRIVSAGLLPLGCAPRSVLEWYLATGRENETRGCIDQINQSVAEYNMALMEKILDLKFDLPDAHIVFCDVYHGVMEMIADPTRYGFENEHSACCGTGWHGAASGCFSQEMACSNSSTHVWWDFYNPTRAVNSLLADSMWHGRPFTHLCHPMTVQDLIHVSR